MPSIVIACYKPKKDKAKLLKKLVKHHTPLLHREKLITKRPPILLESRNGIIIEIFEWASANAKRKAHENPKILKLWEKMEKNGRNVSLSRIGEAKGLFANLRMLK